MEDKTDIISNSVEQSLEIGRKIGKALSGGDVVAMVGNLGSGKTTLTKGIVAGLGGDIQQMVNSPTFVLVNEYQGRFDIFHIDAYRIETPQQLENIGFEDFINPGSVVIVEWADKVKDCLSGLNCVSINIKHNGESSRVISVNGIKKADLL